MLDFCLILAISPPYPIIIRELASDLEEANACNTELSLELGKMKVHCDDLQTELNKAQIAESDACHELEVSLRDRELEVDSMLTQANEAAVRFTHAFSESMQERAARLTLEIDSLHAQVAALSQDLELMTDSEKKVCIERDSAVAAAADFERLFLEEKKTSQHHLSRQSLLQEKVRLLTDQIHAAHEQIASISQNLEQLTVLDAQARAERDSAVASASKFQRMLFQEQKASQVPAAAFLCRLTCC